MFINDAFAQTAAVAPSSMIGTVVQLGLIFAIFYFLLIRPQQKKIKQHELTLASLKVGSKIVTGGGVIGVIKKDNGEKLEVEIAQGVVVEIYRSTIRDAVDAEVEPKHTTKKAKKS